MRKLFFIAVAGLIAMPLWAVEAPGTDSTTPMQKSAITCDVLPWTEIHFFGDVSMTMTPAVDSHHAENTSTVVVKTNDEITMELTGGDLTRTANDDLGFPVAAPAVTWDTLGSGASGTWFATWEEGAYTSNILDVAEGVGADSNNTRGFKVVVDATPEWWDLLAGKYEGTLTLTVSPQS